MKGVKEFVDQRLSELAERSGETETDRLQMNIRLSPVDYFLLNEIGMALDMGRASAAGTALLSIAIREATDELKIGFDDEGVRKRYESFKENRQP